MPVILVHSRGEIRVFCSKFSVFCNSSICCSVAALSYACIRHNYCFTKLLSLILISIFSGVVLSYLKKLEASHIYLLHGIFLNIFASQIIVFSDDIKLNPGPKHSFSSQFPTIFQWNLNSLSSHMYKKTSLLSTYISVQKFDIVCLSEAYLVHPSALAHKDFP